MRPTAARLESHKDCPIPALWDDLPFKVELWNADKGSVELVLAVTASSSIGYAAYHAATREFPDRYIVLRHKMPFLPGGTVRRTDGGSGPHKGRL